MRKNVWIWNHYATNMFFDKAGRHYWFSEHLIKNGYKPTIFCASTNHFYDKNIDTKGKKYALDTVSEIPFIFVDAPDYKDNRKKRILNMLTFYRNLFSVAKEYARLNGKPDVIIASSVHPLTLVAGIKIAKKFGIPCICEIRDLWPESLVAYGSMKRNSIVYKILYQGEKWIYKKADRLIFTMQGGKDYIIDQGWDKGHGKPIDISKTYHINNGVDLEAFNYNKRHYQFEDNNLDDSDTFKVIYTGSIRKVNRVELLVDVAKQLKDTNIKFFIWGDGDHAGRIRQKIQEAKLSNIVYKGRVDKRYIPSIVAKADLNIILGEKSKLLKYGLSPNKLFEYFAAGKPVLQTFKANYSIVEKNGVGIELKESTSISIAKGVELFYKLNKEKYYDLCTKSLKLSKEYDYKELTNKLIEVIEK